MMSELRRPVLFVAVLLPALAGAVEAQRMKGERPACDPEVRAQLVELLAERGEDPKLARELRKKYWECAKDGEGVLERETTRYEYCGKLVYAGSLFYERLRCSGYEPQKRLFNSPVEIRRESGFGPFPVPGSYEYVLSCIRLNNAWVPVAEDRVHLTNAVSGRPDWYTAVTAKAREPLSEMPLDGRTLLARSILSWNLAPNGDCDYRPIWGNVIEYQIRLDPTDQPPPQPAGKKVFVTSTTYTGQLGSFAGAYAKCQARAQAAGLSGTYKAWLSGRPDGFGGQNAADFLTHATVPYVLVDGTRVADDWSDLTDGSLDHAINMDEFGNTVSGNVWTNTETDGSAHDHRRDCGPAADLNDVWDSGSQFESGRYGTSTATDSQWTMTNNTACNNQFRLYCLEQ